jgi:AmmeMemoRadiSam system protein A
MALDEQDQSILAALACRSIEEGLAGKGRPRPSDLDTPARKNLHTPCGAFVTLNLCGRLRGCIGSILAREPLYVTVARMGYAAAFEDPRFPPLRPEEWAGVSMEISVLSVLTRCPDPELIEVGRHGLMLTRGGHSGVFLPQVPVEQGWDRLAYLDALCGKAGLPRGAWRGPDAVLHWYEAFVFHARSGEPAKQQT